MTRSTVCLLIKLLFLVSSVPFLSTPEAVAQTETQRYVEGVVYEDSSNTGAYDTGKAGIEGVMVTNQQDVVVTDENGHYRLPVEEEMIISITKPAGYDLPLDENNLPQFYYIHQPEGSPELEYLGLEPTGSLPESLDFGLIPSEKKESFTAVIFGDPQTRDDAELSYYRDGVVSELATVGADMTLVLGDIMFDDLSLFDRYNRIMHTLDMPIFNIIGNHDLNFDAEDIDEDPNRYARETYKRYYGPTYYSFDYGRVHFIVMDNIDYRGRSGDELPYVGYLDDTHLTWIENNLQNVGEDKLIVLLSHIPLYAQEHDRGNVNTLNRRDLFDLLEDHDRVLYLGGHRHLTYQHFLGEELGRMNPIPIHHIATTAACGSWWSGPTNKRGIPISTQQDGAPNGYHIFQFDGNTYQERFKAAGLDSDYQMRIEAPASSLTVEEVKETELLVNVFNGSERSQVRFRLNDDNEWFEMERLDEYRSPFFTDLYANEGRNATLTNHIWRADLPPLEGGLHKITTWTKDMYGQEFVQTKVIEVE